MPKTGLKLLGSFGQGSVKGRPWHPLERSEVGEAHSPPLLRIPSCPVATFFPFLGEGFPFKINPKKGCPFCPMATGHLRIFWCKMDHELFPHIQRRIDDKLFFFFPARTGGNPWQSGNHVKPFVSFRRCSFTKQTYCKPATPPPQKNKGAFVCCQNLLLGASKEMVMFLLTSV